ncbi:MAG: hypothetical protein OES57_10595 [Acidimicrobiia bacterium]|nr:hypothetical protein [Acidimicrobiia bacterium]
MCWSLKGGVGTSVVAAGLALQLGGSQPSVLVDLAGEQGPLLGVADGERPGVGEWLAAGPDVDNGALARVEIDVAEECVLVPRGSGPLRGGARAEQLAHELAGRSCAVVVDAGCVRGDEAWLAPLLATAASSWLVTRPCYLALRRLRDCPVRPDGVVLVNEPGRALTRADVEAVAEAPVVLDVRWDPAVARAVDAGLLASRLPRSLRRAVQGAR